MLGDLNAKVGHRRKKLVRKYSESGLMKAEILTGICTDRSMMLGNVWF